MSPIRPTFRHAARLAVIATALALAAVAPARAASSPLPVMDVWAEAFGGMDWYDFEDVALHGNPSDTTNNTSASTMGMRIGARLNDFVEIEASYAWRGGTDDPDAITADAADLGNMFDGKAISFGGTVYAFGKPDEANDWSPLVGVTYKHINPSNGDLTAGDPTFSSRHTIEARAGAVRHMGNQLLLGGHLAGSTEREAVGVGARAELALTSRMTLVGDALAWLVETGDAQKGYTLSGGLRLYM